MQVEEILKRIETEIDSRKFGDNPQSLYAPIRYIMGLGGKRIRPVLTCLGYSVFKDDVERVIPVAACVETFHNFTLMHDDIMDNAPLRRGKPTVHKKWNVSTAILSGDVMLVKVYERLLESLSRDQVHDVLTIFNSAAVEVCEGQQLDMEFETSKQVTEAQYIEMISLKTAALLGFSLELGALLAGASVGDRDSMRRFGINLGVGFQLHDDYLDVYADGKKFGKQVGGDILSNKKTFLLIKAIELAKGRAKSELLKWLSAKRYVKQQKVKAITRLYNELGIQEIAQSKIKERYNLAMEDLASVKGSTSLLKEFAAGLMERQR
jgi:geranylgeranyl diphosphate synthase type II